ncbi:MAG: hypothetical protein KDB32_02480 [Planctomycetes bacterium]|nr:hypothetical protein [Planctomycetota bacterium]
MSVTNNRTLHDDVRDLAELPPSESPIVSCYLDLRSSAPTDWKGALVDRFSLLRRTIDPDKWHDVRQCFDRIRAFMSFERDKNKKGVALFVREGTEPFFLAREFDTSVPTFIAVDEHPDIYHLVEMKETFHRYIVAVIQPTWARVLEVNIGSASIEALQDHPQTRDRVAQELTHTHYARHGDFVRGPYLLEVAETLERLVLTDGHKHLLLAGDTDCVVRLEDTLPLVVTDNVMELLHVDEGERPDIVADTIHRFVHHLEDSSDKLIDVFRESFYRDELAIAGVDQVLAALEREKVDTLLLSLTVHPEVCWRCEDCGTHVASIARPHSCRGCGSTAFIERDTLGELTRLAERGEARIEVVRKNSLLDRVGGVGALLRWA